MIITMILFSSWVVYEQKVLPKGDISRALSHAETSARQPVDGEERTNGALVPRGARKKKGLQARSRV